MWAFGISIYSWSPKFELRLFHAQDPRYLVDFATVSVRNCIFEIWISIEVTGISIQPLIFIIHIKLCLISTFYGFRYRENILCSCYCQSSGMLLLIVLQFYPLALFLKCFLNILLYPLPTEKYTLKLFLKLHLWKLLLWVLMFHFDVKIGCLALSLTRKLNLVFFMGKAPPCIDYCWLILLYILTLFVHVFIPHSLVCMSVL